MAKASALRTSLIWNDEVMSDVVSERPQEITIGPFDGATFITPPIGLPQKFAIVSPGSRGNVLTLGEHMRGTVCISGAEHDVATLVRTSDTPGFFATAIGGLDWGVIELDASGAYKVFFQHVPLDEAGQPRITRPVLVAGAIGYGLSSLVLGALFVVKGIDVGEALFRGLGLATLALGAAAIVRWVLKQDSESRASLAFSTILHAAILFATLQLYSSEDPNVYPGSRDLTASYIVSRIENTPTIVPVPPAKRAPTITPASEMPAAAQFVEPPPPKKDPPKTAKSNQPNAKPNPGDSKKPSKDEDPPRPGAASQITGIQLPGDDGARNELAKSMKPGGKTGGNGPKRIGTKTGKGDEPGGGDGKPAGDYQEGSKDPINTGGVRTAVMCVGSGCGGGGGPTVVTPIDNNRDSDGTGLTSIDIDRVIKANQRLLTRCYQMELNRQADLAGTVQVRFVISADGHVESSRTVAGSTIKSTVGDCVARTITLLRFPKKGRAVVNYPFVFNSH
jgi:hypothetical protein